MTNNYMYDYTKFNSKNQLFLPMNLEANIPKNDSVRLPSHIMEGLDYSKINWAYSSKGRNLAVDPKIILKIIIYSYSQGIDSSRNIQNTYEQDINFMWLLNGTKAPDHCAISRFRKKYLSE